LRFVVKTKSTSKLVPVVIEVWNALPDVKILQAFDMRKKCAAEAIEDGGWCWLSAKNCFLIFVVKTKNISKLVPVVIEVWNALPDVKILQAFDMRKKCAAEAIEDGGWCNCEGKGRGGAKRVHVRVRLGVRCEVLFRRAVVKHHYGPQKTPA